jgi:hypothetical protein
MIAKESTRPFESAGGAARHTQERRAQRKIWACPIAGCPRVAASGDDLNELDELDEEFDE